MVAGSRPISREASVRESAAILGRLPGATRLFFLPNPLEGFSVRLLVHPTASVCITLGPAAVAWVVGLRAVANRPVPVTVAFWGIGGHDLILLIEDVCKVAD